MNANLQGAAVHVVLWDTRELSATKEFAGGFGVGFYGGRGLRGRIISRFYRRDRRPVALVFAYLAAIFHRLGHRVQYVQDRDPPPADLYVFCPSLLTLHLERAAITRLLVRAPTAQVLVVGPVASIMPEAFSGLKAIVVKGEAEQLLWKLDEVLARPAAVVQLGTIENLDLLPTPDWSVFRPQRFRIAYDFWRFPTALVQASRGCSFHCNYCPYIVLDNSVRHRDPDAVADEIAQATGRWGFRSFKFRDPLFGLDRQRVFRLADRLGQLPRKIQFSVETRVELLPLEVLRALARVGLTSVTVGIETPDAETLRQHRRTGGDADRQREFIAASRRLGIRTVAGFLLGFPHDSEESIRGVLRYAKELNPTFANFNLVTPYPGTEFYEHIQPQIADFDFSHYTVYTPVLKYQHLTAERVRQLHARSFSHFYFRWDYLRDNAPLLWPSLRRIAPHRGTASLPAVEPPHPAIPKPPSGLDLLKRKGLRQDQPHRRR